MRSTARPGRRRRPRRGRRAGHGRERRAGSTATTSGTTAASPGTTRSRRRCVRSCRAPLVAVVSADLPLLRSRRGRGAARRDARARARDRAGARRRARTPSRCARRASSARTSASRESAAVHARRSACASVDPRPSRPRLRRRHARRPRQDAGRVPADARLQGLGGAVRRRASCSTSRVRGRAARARARRRLRPLPALAPHGGHGPHACPGSARSASAPSARCSGTSVLTPTMRYHPSMIAQAFGDARLPEPGPGLPRRRHRRVAERDARDRRASGPARRSAACGSPRRSS